MKFGRGGEEMKKKLFIGVLILLTCVCVWHAFQDASEEKNIACVTIIRPEEKLLTESIHTRGTLKGAESALISPEKGGRVTKLNAEKGNQVTKGQFLFSVYDGEETRNYYAPFTGVVGAVWLEEGVPAVPGVTFVSMTSRESMIVSSEVEESRLSYLEVGQSVNITLDAYPERRYHGEVREILPYATVSGGAAAILMEQGTTTVEVRIDILEDTDDLIPGLSASSDIVTGVYPAALMLPCGAVMNDEKGDYVFLYDSGQARKQYIEKGIYYDGAYQILSGLEESSDVIALPTDELKDGDRVKLS